MRSPARSVVSLVILILLCGGIWWSFGNGRTSDAGAVVGSQETSSKEENRAFEEGQGQGTRKLSAERKETPPEEDDGTWGTFGDDGLPDPKLLSHLRLPQ